MTSDENCLVVGHIAVAVESHPLDCCEPELENLAADNEKNAAF